MSQKRKKKERKAESLKLKVESGSNEKIRGVRQILKENWKFLVVLCVGIFLVYLNSLWGDFVSDDYASITQNPDILSFERVLATLHVPAICNTVIAKIFGIDSSIPYHFLNLFLFLGICVLAFIFIAILFNRVIAILTLVLFAFHPVHVEAVSWISGRPYLLTTAFILSALVCGLMYLKRKNKKYIFALLLNLTLMFFTDKIRGFSFFLLVVLVAFSFREKYFRNLSFWKVIAGFFLSLAIVGIFAYPLAMKRIESVNSGYNSSESIFYDPFFQYPTAVAKYLQLLLVPVDLTLYHTMYIFPVWLNWVIFILYLVSLIYFFFKNKEVFFALAFVFVATAPSMMPVKVSWLVAERYVFFGSLGFCLLIGIIFADILRKRKLVVASLLGVLVAGGSIRTILRNIDWQTNHNLWVNTCQVSPNSHNAWNNIGDDYDKLNQYENAIKGFTQSTVVKPNYADAYHNRANIFFKTRRLDLARSSYETALYYSPSLVQTYFSLTQIDLFEKRFDLALNHAKKAVEIQPNNPQAYYVLGIVNAQMGNGQEAKRIFESILKAVPNFVLAREALLKLGVT